MSITLWIFSAKCSDRVLVFPSGTPFPFARISLAGGTLTYFVRGESPSATSRPTLGAGAEADAPDGRLRRSSDAVASSTTPAPPASACGVPTDTHNRIPAASTKPTINTGHTQDDRTDSIGGMSAVEQVRCQTIDHRAWCSRRAPRCCSNSVQRRRLHVGAARARPVARRSAHERATAPVATKFFPRSFHAE